MNKILKRIITIFIILGVAFLLVWPKLDDLEAGEQNEQESSANQVSKTPVEARIVNPVELNNTIQVNGSVLANEAVDISSEIAGKVTHIHFNEGERVQKGDLLVSINDSELQAQLEKAIQTRELRANNEQRQKKLLEREAISEEDYDIALTELKNAKAEIDLLKAKIDKTQIRAPFNGTIGLRYISEGSYITPQTEVASLYNLNPAKIEFSIPAKYSNQVHKGSKIRFSSKALGQDTLTATLYAIEPKVDDETRTLKMRAYTQNDRRRLLPGHFLSIQLILNSTQNAIMVPTQAVVPMVNGHKVFVNQKGKVNAKQVKVGTRTNTEVEIQEGLNPQDTVIITGTQQIQDGASIEITSFN